MDATNKQWEYRGIVKRRVFLIGFPLIVWQHPSVFIRKLCLCITVLRLLATLWHWGERSYLRLPCTLCKLLLQWQGIPGLGICLFSGSSPPQCRACIRNGVSLVSIFSVVQPGSEPALYILPVISLDFLNKALSNKITAAEQLICSIVLGKCYSHAPQRAAPYNTGNSP